MADALSDGVEIGQPKTLSRLATNQVICLQNARKSVGITNMEFSYYKT